MPREQITHNTEPQQKGHGGLMDSKTASQAGNNVHIGWRDGEVTVGVDITLEAIKHIASQNSRVGYAPRLVHTSDPLDRKELNKLISTLRRARDKAYGADA